MNPDDFSPSPSIADEVKLGVDNAQVIAKTLPPAPMRNRAARLKEEAGHAVEFARGCVIERPVQSVLIAAAGGAALTAGLIAFMRGDRL